MSNLESGIHLGQSGNLILNADIYIARLKQSSILDKHVYGKARDQCLPLISSRSSDHISSRKCRSQNGGINRTGDFPKLNYWKRLVYVKYANPAFLFTQLKCINNFQNHSFLRDDYGLNTFQISSGEEKKIFHSFVYVFILQQERITFTVDCQQKRRKKKSPVRFL